MTTRRAFLHSAALTVAALSTHRSLFAADAPPEFLEEFGYGDVTLAPGRMQTQFDGTQAVLLALNEDSLLKPWRLRAGLPAPGPDLGGWYDEVSLDKTESGGHGFAPAHCFGQWVSALARGYAVDRNARTKARLARLLDLYGAAISGRFYKNFRYPAYNYDKMVIGLIDAHQFAGMSNAFALLERTTDAAEPYLPPHALDRDEPQRRWRASVGDNTTDDYTWDESYTMPENLYLAWKRGAGERYRMMAPKYLLDATYFDPLSENRNVLGNHHAYSFCNALSSAMQAYISGGSRKHLQAASNAFDMITATQSFATGGWGPNESFGAPGSGALYASLTESHRGFETPCGSYAHFKLTRYLLRVTKDGRYGDSMERVLYNTVLGAKPLLKDGHAFYYSDYNFAGQRAYFPDAFPCCGGTLPQVAADYRTLAYFHDRDGVYVNLYLPSTLGAEVGDGARLKLTQETEYPLEERIAMRMQLSRPAEFALRLRIPAWSAAAPEGHSVRVNGQAVNATVVAGFATLRRRWKDGDRVELRLPLANRLEAIDAEHPHTVALVRGPLVLFTLTDGTPRMTRQQMLDAQRVPGSRDTWQVDAAGGTLRLRPFFALEEDRYTTYVNLV